MEPSYIINPEEIDYTKIININIGVLGHVDSGKTSLSRSLSKIASTASFDKNPQSQQRGITLDLGFSAFYAKKDNQIFQFTLVDCPGHASLIRTILAGANIIDIMFLVIDINKGIQTQTAECLVIGEILISKIIVVLNKLDLLPKENRNNIIQKKIESLKKVFSKTKYGSEIPFIPISANINAQENGGDSENLDILVKTLINSIEIPKRNLNGEFLYLIDHCFPIKGQGTVVTGTIVQGKAKIGDEIEFPQINEKKKIKSMQMFKKNIEKAGQGDRIGMLIPGLDSSLIERGMACQPGFIKEASVIFIQIKKVNYFKHTILSKTKFHITSDHQTVMGIITIFKSKNINKEILEFANNNLNHKVYQNIDINEEYLYLEEFKDNNNSENIFAAIVLEKELLCSLGGLIIGAKLDTDINANICRLAFYGNIIQLYNKKNITELEKIKICKEKEKKGVVEEIIDNYMIKVKNLFKKENNIADYIGKNVILSNNNYVGKIHSAFGKSGKIKVSFDKNLFENEEEKKSNDITQEILNSNVIFKYNKYFKIKI